MEKGCRNCLWLYSMVSHIPTAPCYECLDYNKWQTTKPTNYDLLIQKTPEEMAEWIRDQIIDRNIGIPSGIWLDWLKEEARE